MVRMKKVLEKKIGMQDIELEEKVLASKGKKKWIFDVIIRNNS